MTPSSLSVIYLKAYPSFSLQKNQAVKALDFFELIRVELISKNPLSVKTIIVYPEKLLRLTAFLHLL